MTAFDAAKARQQALSSEFSFSPSGGGHLLLSADDVDGLALTVTDREDPKTEATVWLGHRAAADLHLWMTLALAATEWDPDNVPEMYDTTDLVYPGELAVVYAPDENDAEHPFSVEAIDYDEDTRADASVLLTVADVREFYPLMTMVMLAMGALA